MSTETIRDFAPSEEMLGLRSSVERISLESDAVIIADKYTTESVSDFFKSVSHAISGWFEEKSDYLGDLRPSPAVLEKLESLNAKALESLVLPIPVGFKGNFADYQKVLVSQRMELIDNFEVNILDPLERLIGLYINRPSLMANLKVSEESKKFKFSDLDKMFKERDKFATGKNVDAALFYSLYRSTNEFKNVGSSINATMNAVEKQNIERIRKRIESLEERINVLTEYFVDKDNPYKLSGNVGRELSKLLLEVAEHAEHYSYLRHKTMEFGKIFKTGFEAITLA